MNLKIGSKLCLHEPLTHYEIVDFRFRVYEETGTWIACVYLKNLNSVIPAPLEYPVDMILDLLRSSDLYPAEQENLMKGFHEARKKRLGESET